MKALWIRRRKDAYLFRPHEYAVGPNRPVDFVRRFRGCRAASLLRLARLHAVAREGIPENLNEDGHEKS